MLTSTIHNGNTSRKPVRLAMALVLAAALGSLAAAPALARDEHGGGHQARGGHDHGHDRGHGGGGFDVGVYADPVYAPAPVYYDPQPSPGISVMLPLNVRIR
jgi:hypothetical protein